MEKLLQIGSVFKIEEISFLVIGYTFQNTDNKPQFGYKCIGLPYGYIKKDSIKFISVDNASNIIYNANNDEAKEFVEYQTTFFEKIEELGVELSMEILRAFESGVRKELETDE